jgi:hypothetical protein
MARRKSLDRGSPVRNRLNPDIGRRDLLRVLTIGGAAATTSACVSGEAGGEAGDFPDNGRAPYQADSPEVQTFYRVNRYPAK